MIDFQPAFFSWGNAQNEGMGIPPLPSFLGIPAYLPYDMTKVVHQIEEVEIVSIQKKKNKLSVVEPTLLKFLEVEGNSLTLAGFVRESRIGSFVRNGRAPVVGISNALKTTGNVLGGIGIGVTGYQYFSGQISGTEASVDTVMGIVGFIGPVGGAISLTYFAGKAIYEYSSGNTLFDKPKP